MPAHTLPRSSTPPQSTRLPSIALHPSLSSPQNPPPPLALHSDPSSNTPPPLSAASSKSPNREDSPDDDPALSRPISASINTRPDPDQPAAKRTNTGKAPHKCHQCGQTFTRQHNLKSHLLTHSQEKPFVCQHCNQDFRRLHDLKRHYKLHTGEKPYSCRVCQRSFARQDALNRHLKPGGECSTSVHLRKQPSRANSLPVPPNMAITSDTRQPPEQHNDQDNQEQQQDQPLKPSLPNTQHRPAAPNQSYPQFPRPIWLDKSPPAPPAIRTNSSAFPQDRTLPAPLVESPSQLPSPSVNTQDAAIIKDLQERCEKLEDRVRFLECVIDTWSTAFANSGFGPPNQNQSQNR